MVFMIKDKATKKKLMYVIEQTEELTKLDSLFAAAIGIDESRGRIRLKS